MYLQVPFCYAHVRVSMELEASEKRDASKSAPLQPFCFRRAIVVWSRARRRPVLVRILRERLGGL